MNAPRQTDSLVPQSGKKVRDPSHSPTSYGDLLKQYRRRAIEDGELSAEAEVAYGEAICSERRQGIQALLASSTVIQVLGQWLTVAIGSARAGSGGITHELDDRPITWREALLSPLAHGNDRQNTQAWRNLRGELMLLAHKPVNLAHRRLVAEHLVISYDGFVSLMKVAEGELTVEYQHQVQRSLSIQQGLINSLVEHNLRLATFCSRFYNRDHELSCDVLQRTLEFLIRAAQKWDYRQGTRFSTYATPWVSAGNEQGRFDASFLFDIRRKSPQKWARCAAARGRIEQRLGRPATLTEVAHEAEITLSELQELCLEFTPAVSLDTPIRSDEDDDRALSENLPAAPAPENEPDLRVRHELLNEALQILTPFEREVLCLTVGFNGGKALNQSAVALKLHARRQMVRAAFESAVAKLRTGPDRGTLLEEHTALAA